MEKFTVKVVGRRKPQEMDLAKAGEFLKLAIRLRGGKPFIPRGVYRFKTFEESQAWVLKMLTRSSNRDLPS